MSDNRSQRRSSYQIGDLVYALHEGRHHVLAVTAHSGDNHYNFADISLVREAGVPEGYDRIRVKEDAAMYTGHAVGPRVGHLDEQQMMRIGVSVDVPAVEIPIKDLVSGTKYSNLHPCLLYTSPSPRD